jgi:hypothetical protein
MQKTQARRVHGEDAVTIYGQNAERQHDYIYSTMRIAVKAGSIDTDIKATWYARRVIMLQWNARYFGNEAFHVL